MNILVVFYSMYGHVYKLAEAVAEGARQVEGATVQPSRRMWMYLLRATRILTAWNWRGRRLSARPGFSKILGHLYR